MSQYRSSKVESVLNSVTCHIHAVNELTLIDGEDEDIPEIFLGNHFLAST